MGAAIGGSTTISGSGSGRFLIRNCTRRGSGAPARRGVVALVEDYVELIADLIEDGNEARQVDIAARLGVAQPTVAKDARAAVRRRPCDAQALSRAFS